MSLPIWNLSQFYESIEDNQINKDFKNLLNISQKFQKKYRGKLESLTAKSLYNSLEEFESITEIIQKIQSFAYLTYCTDQLVDKIKKFYQEVEEKISNIEKHLIFYGIELNNLSSKKLETFKNTKYVNWIKNHRKFKKFQKTEDNEKLLMEKSITSTSAWIKFFDQSMARLKFKINGKFLNETEILNLLSSTESKIRKNAAEVFGETLKENIF